MIKKTKLIIGILSFLLLITSSSEAHARIIFADDVFENNSEVYEIGSDDDATATTLTLEFGGTNAESLTWNTSIFTLSDDLTVQGNLIATDITANGTLDANGPVTLGDNGDTIVIDSSNWDITAAGDATLNDLTLSSFTQGSVLFTGAGGTVDEDNTNLFWDDTNDELGIATTTPNDQLTVVSQVAGGNNIGMEKYTDDGNSGNLNYRKARGNLGAPTNAQAGDYASNFRGYGYVDGAFRNLANIRFGIESVDAVNDNAGGFIWLGTAESGPGGGIFNERIRIEESGNVGIGPGAVGGNADELTHIASATDGDQNLILLENSQANAAASTNETAQLQFGFGGINDAARIVAGKEADYTSGANEDSFLSFYTDLDGTAIEAFRLDSNANANLSGTILTLDSDNTGAGINTDIVSEQGTDSNGTIRYDATDNRWKISNDGNAFRDIHMASVFYTYDNTGGQSLTGTEITLNFDSVTETITDADYTFTDGADTVEFNEDGLYKITVEVGTDDTNTGGGARASNEIRIQEDPLGVAAWADIPGGFTECYHRETTMNNCGLEIIRSFTATDEIRVRLIRTSGSTNMETQPQASHILIERIR